MSLSSPTPSRPWSPLRLHHTSPLRHQPVQPLYPQFRSLRGIDGDSCQLPSGRDESRQNYGNFEKKFRIDFLTLPEVHVRSRYIIYRLLIWLLFFDLENGSSRITDTLKTNSGQNGVRGVCSKYYTCCYQTPVTTVTNFPCVPNSLEIEKGFTKQDTLRG